MGILVFFLGAVVGAVFSVWADRLYRRWVESVPMVRVKASCAYSYEFGQRFNLVITNVGFTELQPYDVVLYNPRGGSLQTFWRTEESERLPGQQDVFSFSVSEIRVPNPQQHIDMLLKMLTLSYRTRQDMTEEEFKQWRLRLVLTHSDNVVLFEHGPSGAAIAEVLRDIVRSGQVFPTGEQMYRIDMDNSWTFRGRRKAIATVRAASTLWRRLREDDRVRKLVVGLKSWYSGEAVHLRGSVDAEGSEGSRDQVPRA